MRVSVSELQTSNKQLYNSDGDQVGNLSHIPGRKAEPAVYPLPVDEKSLYTLMGRVPYSLNAKPGSQTAFEIASGGKITAFKADQAKSTGQWIRLGEFDLEPGAVLRIVPSRLSGFVAADGFALIKK